MNRPIRDTLRIDRLRAAGMSPDWPELPVTDTLKWHGDREPRAGVVGGVSDGFARVMGVGCPCIVRRRAKTLITVELNLNDLNDLLQRAGMRKV